ncbi:MAG: UbiD family decarboxylase [Bacillota bacterium]|nr:UbiD family decarboxylase [Bacillota bacterium]
MTLFSELINGKNSPVKIISYSKEENIKPVKKYLEDISNNTSRFVIVVDSWVDIEDLSTVSWKIFNNIDPKRDSVIKMREDSSIFIGIDATRKGDDPEFTRNWPDDIEMSEEIKDLVDKWWPKYGITSNK